MSRLRDQLQEIRELGVAGLAFRLKWEFALRSGIAEALERAPTPLTADLVPSVHELLARIPFSPGGVAEAMRDRLSRCDRANLLASAREATHGRIVAFGRWNADCGNPPDWHLNPLTGACWDSDTHWSRALRDERRCGDVKLAWELARFPHAWSMARAAVHEPSLSAEFATALAAQVASFLDANPFGRGIHWSSGQEIIFRLVAWLFALRAFGPASPFAGVHAAMANALHDGAVHVERHIGYARRAVYNNHLLAEAFGLLLAGTALPAASCAERWRRTGIDILTEQADRQFYEDGGYIQQSHNYERVALQVFLWATALHRANAAPVPDEWLRAMGRAVDFLFAQQNRADGRLPNYGANDGALAAPLTSCDYSDFRPTLQAASVAARGERLYEPGPWDEETAWVLGPGALEAPLQQRPQTSVSFAATGFHVLRGRDEGTFATFRCGTVRDRFSQIDMLHLDLWWKGENVIVDAGSYLYNGSPKWHSHFVETASHNTVALDGRDQMLHHRRFKTLYWTRAKLLRFEERPELAVVEGEHYGYVRHPGRCVHRRAVLQVTDRFWVVVDRIAGQGAHLARLHWLCGPYAYAWNSSAGRLVLATPKGPFEIALLDLTGVPLHGDVVAGRESPPRGWLSRYYGEKVPAPSLAVECRGVLPFTFVTLLSGSAAEVKVSDGEWWIRGEGIRARFRIEEGRIEVPRIDSE